MTHCLMLKDQRTWHCSLNIYTLKLTQKHIIHWPLLIHSSSSHFLTFFRFLQLLLHASIVFCMKLRHIWMLEYSYGFQTHADTYIFPQYFVLIVWFVVINTRRVSPDLSKQHMLNVELVAVVLLLFSRGHYISIPVFQFIWGLTCIVWLRTNTPLLPKPSKDKMYHP
jgi:hypothetical protein